MADFDADRSDSTASTNDQLHMSCWGKKHEPHDKHNLAYSIFFLLGAGTVFPWNAVIGAVDFWSKLYPAWSPMYWFEGCEMLPNFGFTALMVLFGEKVGMRTKLLGGNVLGSVVLMAACVCAAFSNENDQHSKKVAMFGATLGGVFLTGVTAALTNAGLFGLAAQFPQRYTQSAMSGQALAGVLICVLRIITKEVYGTSFDGVRKSSLLYFGVTCFFMLLCAAGYMTLRQLPFVRYQLDEDFVGDESLRESLLADVSTGNTPCKGLPSSPRVTRLSDVSAEAVPVKSVFRKVRGLGLLVLVTFCTTLAVFPGLLVGIKSHLFTSDSTWFQVIIITLFNVFDLAGRVLAGVWLPRSRVPVITVTTLRCFLVPMLVLMASDRIVISSTASDWTVFGIVFVLAITNGYIGSYAMMLAPASLEPHERELGGTTMVMMLLAGLCSGSLSAIGLLQIVNALKPVTLNGM